MKGSAQKQEIISHCLGMEHLVKVQIAFILSLSSGSCTWRKGTSLVCSINIHLDAKFAQTSPELIASFYSLVHCLEAFLLKASFAVAFSCVHDLECCFPWHFCQDLNTVWLVVKLFSVTHRSQILFISLMRH